MLVFAKVVIPSILLTVLLYNILKVCFWTAVCKLLKLGVTYFSNVWKELRILLEISALMAFLKFYIWCSLLS